MGSLEDRVKVKNSGVSIYQLVLLAVDILSINKNLEIQLTEIELEDIFDSYLFRPGDPLVTSRRR